MCTEAHVLFCPALAAGYFTITTHLTNLVRSCGKFKLKAITFFSFFSFGLYSTFLYFCLLFSLESSHLFSESVFTAEPLVSYQ